MEYKNINFSIGSEKKNNTRFDDDSFEIYDYEIEIAALEFQKLSIDELLNLYKA